MCIEFLSFHLQCSKSLILFKHLYVWMYVNVRICMCEWWNLVSSSSLVLFKWDILEIKLIKKIKKWILPYYIFFIWTTNYWLKYIPILARLVWLFKECKIIQFLQLPFVPGHQNIDIGQYKNTIYLYHGLLGNYRNMN